MHRRILIAEQADTLRSVAETVLRQNGYDVISVAAAEKAREVLELSRPDLILIGADLLAPDGKPYHERIRSDKNTASLPMLLFEPADKSDTGLPPEVIVPRPFDPKDLLRRVSVFLGSQASAPPPAAVPQGLSAVDDDFLDAALGLDQLDVTDSEEMDKTVIGRQKGSRTAKEKLIGLDTAHELGESSTGIPIDSLVLGEDDSVIKHAPVSRTLPRPNATGKIDILSDQFGMTETPAADSDEGGVHDYDWFVDAVKQDNDPNAAKPAPESNDSGRLHISDPSEAIDPITPGPVSPSSGSSKTVGVEKFIDEFKKEMEVLRETDTDGPVVPEVITQAVEEAGASMAWEEKLEQLGSSQVDIFAREFARELGRKVAEIIVAKIDPEKLLRLIKAEIVEKYRSSN